MTLETSNNMIGTQARIIDPTMQNNVSLVMIICNHCPYVLFRMNAISQLVKDYKDNVTIIAVNSNDASPDTEDSKPEDAPEYMPAFKEKYDLQCKYIFDEDQSIARDYGAVCTPEFYVINKKGTIVYHGELDPSHTSNDLMPTGSSLRHALDLTLTNKDINWNINPSFGCSVKWKTVSERHSEKNRDRTHVLDVLNNYKFNVSDEEMEVINTNINITVTTPFHLTHLRRTIADIVEKNIQGDLVECGVFMGGSSRAMLHTLTQLNESRTLWMYDTYEGVPMPDSDEILPAGFFDYSESDSNLKEWYEQERLTVEGSNWCYSSFDHVSKNISELDHICEVNMIKGLVEDTIPGTIPDQIALLRVDVDLTAPTLHVLEHMYDLVQSGGYIIFDDYYFFPKTQEVIDEFLKDKQFKIINEPIISNDNEHEYTDTVLYIIKE